MITALDMRGERRSRFELSVLEVKPEQRSGGGETRKNTKTEVFGVGRDDERRDTRKSA
jgi:hypothetical protein